MFASLIAAVMAATTPPPAAATLPPPVRRQELLFEAARLGRTDLIAPLVTSGVDVNARDPRGFTPLSLAAYNDHLDTVNALIAAKADACLPDRDQGNTAQMGVAFKGYDPIAARLLKAGCDVNARNKAGQTALMMAALFGRTTQIDMLVAAGADRAVLDAAGNSAASVAAGQGNDKVVKQLGR
ncbi:ankyrin repeat domain-containing protein [Sphingomonas solaris]|uniref:Ankyrin repeat domain-containing protein n=1 Tax=Alterirhizorhabdus solaris TaxID=2529389 RepID=A0A558R9T6_9SPHN|nr:ankyrin repeat domain-containing protein [Sphingomonas solaris]TVV76146.1 ankyrin repeat domain-containing protein [Sphingomonas solaris]